MSALASTHIEQLGVKVKSSRCRASGHGGDFSCTLRTPTGVSVAVTVGHDLRNNVVYTTTAGLIDGRVVGRRLSQQLGQRLRQNITAKCPAVTAANTRDTFTCEVWPTATPAQRHQATITVLDDHTGDFTYRIT